MEDRKTRIRAPHNLDKWAAAEFDRIRDELESVGYEKVDQPALLAYLQHYSYWCQARELISNEGLIITTPSGIRKIHPAFSLLKQNSELLKKYIENLAFSPGTRKRLKLELNPAKADDSDLFG